MHTVSTAFALTGPGPRAELAQLRPELIVLADRLHRPGQDSALLWAGTTLARLLEPASLGSGLDDWVLRAALTLMVEACEERGLTGRRVAAPRRALELLDQLDPTSSYGGPRRGGA
jgi:hypothetical protein